MGTFNVKFKKRKEERRDQGTKEPRNQGRNQGSILARPLVYKSAMTHHIRCGIVQCQSRDPVSAILEMSWFCSVFLPPFSLVGPTSSKDNAATSVFHVAHYRALILIGQQVDSGAKHTMDWTSDFFLGIDVNETDNTDYSPWEKRGNKTKAERRGRRREIKNRNEKKKTLGNGRRKEGEGKEEEVLEKAKNPRWNKKKEIGSFHRLWHQCSH